MEFQLNEIYNIDALAAMEEMPAKSIPIILTSPPFRDKDIQGDYWTWYDRFMKCVDKVCSEYAFVFNSSTRLNEIVIRYKVGLGSEDGRIPPFRILCWVKGIIERPGGRYGYGMAVQYSYRWQPIFIYRFTEQWNINGKIWSDVLPYAPLLEGDPEKLHPYQDPLKLYRHLVKYVPKDKLILDPFMGSGTTAVACKDLGHPFLGFEINPDIYRIAKMRLNNTLDSV